MSLKLMARDFDHFSGIWEEWYVDTLTNKIVVRGVQENDPILDANTQMLNSKSAKSSKLNENEGLGTMVARIPIMWVEQRLKETGQSIFTCSDAELHRIINDYSYSKFRTAHGRV